jgi:hypothetical protein
MSNKRIAFVLSSVLYGLAVAAPTMAESPSAPVAGKVTLGVTVAESDLIAVGWRASKLLRAEVRNDKDEKIGSIDDLIVAPDGTLSIAIIEVGGFLGIGGHKVAIPMRQLAFVKAPHKIMLHGASKEALKALPEFKYTS